MFYDFPIITHIDEVREAIAGREDFYESVREGYSIFNYMIRLPDSFPFPGDAPDEKTARLWAIRRECRGLTMAHDGGVLKRPFHKFFNIGEVAETFPEKVNLSNPHIVLDKLDGSMITPFYWDNRFSCHTKMGETDVAAFATDFMKRNKNYEYFSIRMIELGMTPIFEYCSTNNRIVVLYPNERLILTAMRVNLTGDYMSRDALHKIASHFEIECVKTWDSETDVGDFVSRVRAENDGEGYVLEFSNGHKAKVKNEWYCLIHKTKEVLAFEKDVLRLCLEDAIDDILPHLVDIERDKLMDYNRDLMLNMLEFAHSLDAVVNDAWEKYGKNDKKAFAINVAGKHKYRGLLFDIYDSKASTFDLVKAHVLKNTSSSSKVDGLRDIIKVKW